MSETAIQKIEPMPSPAIEPTTPQALMRRATDVASVCREIVLKTAVQIQGRKFLRVEGWESIATAHGCFAGAEDAERAYDNQGNHIGYKAQGVLRNAHGEVIATGEGFVGFDEKDRKGNPTWKNRDEYAGRAMAQTRAISRTCRGVFAHVVVLIDAGLSTTPAEEVPDGGFDDNERAARAKPVNPGTAKGADGAKSSSAPASKLPEATEAQRQKWIGLLKPLGQAALDYAYENGWLVAPDDNMGVPGEPIEVLSLTHVPRGKKQAQAILAEIQARMDGQKPQGASGPPSTSAPAEKGAQNTAKQAPATAQSESGDSDGPASERWYNAIVPVPRAGEKRDAYLKNPETIGELYDLRHDDEQARRRLFGFVFNFEPKGWTNRQGKQMPPSESDLKFRDDLDAFYAWFEENHPDEVKSD